MPIRAAFLSRYPAVTNIAGQYTGSLDNAGERLYLEGALREPILDFAYDDTWYPTTDGHGFSLVIRNEYALVQHLDEPGQLAPQHRAGRLARDALIATPPTIPAVLINEALTHTDPPRSDSVELYNPTAEPGLHRRLVPHRRPRQAR